MALINLFINFVKEFFCLAKTSTIVVAMSSTYAMATHQNCNPILLFIEGGGWSSSKSNSGKLLRDLAKQVPSENTTIKVIDNSFYMVRVYWVEYLLPFKFWVDEGKAIQTATELMDSNYSPIVIVGHSLGAATAHLIALNLWRPSLLVTLDGVSWWGDAAHLPHPGVGKRWININATDNGWGPDWDSQGRTDKFLTVNANHKDVFRMLFPIMNDIREWLLDCDQ